MTAQQSLIYRAIGALGIVFILSGATHGASLAPDETPGPGASSAAPGHDFLIRGAAERARKAEPLVDLNNNGLSDGLEKTLAGLGPQAEVDVVVTFSGPGNAASAQRAVGPFRVKHEFRLIDGFAAAMSARQARALAGVPGVFRVEEDFLVHAQLEWARSAVGADAVLNDATLPYTGDGVRVCVIDTGIQGDHEAFNDDGGTRIMAFRDFIGDYTGTFQTLPYDDFQVGHGTHVAGIIASDGVEGPVADGGDPVNAPKAKGFAPGAHLYVAKALDYNGSGAESIIIQAMEWCVDQSVDVINMSLGAEIPSRGKDALAKAATNVVNAGVVLVAAAGNSGDLPESIVTPAVAEEAIAVGAGAEWASAPEACIPDPLSPDCSASLGLHAAPFTSRGPAPSGLVKPDIVGPGVTILSATNNEFVLFDPFFGFFFGNNGCGIGCYRILSGTSMATPAVTGTVALMLEANPTLTPLQVKQILADTAQHRGLGAGQNNLYGHGFLDTYAAVKRALDANDTSATVFPSGLSGMDMVPSIGSLEIPITVIDPDLPLAVTVSIDGTAAESCVNLPPFGQICSTNWEPDIDGNLIRNADGQTVFSSGCPALGDCAGAGHQETFYVAPPHPADGYTLELFLWDGDPNYNQGGSFAVTYDISNGNAEVIAPLVANAGPDRTVTDDDGDGVASVMLDGSGSLGNIVRYEWFEEPPSPSTSIATDMTPTVNLAVGEHTITLQISDDTGGAATDIVVVTVKEKKGGGGGGGNCNNPNKPGCS